jgi:gas vesicle protein
MSDGLKVFWGFLGGAAVGAIAGLIFAPDKGSVTRQNISQKTVELKDEVATGLKNGLDKFNSFKDTAFSLVNNYGEEGTKNTKSNQGGTL